MSIANISIKSTLLTVAAAVVCTGSVFAAIDSLAAPRAARTDAQIVQLPMVVVSAQRDGPAVAVQQLPQVVVVGQRLARATAGVRGSDATTRSAG